MSEPSRELRVRNAGEADEMKIIELLSRAFRHLASLAGADPRQMASNLPKKIWNFIA
jgi:hypothetical protein